MKKLNFLFLLIGIQSFIFAQNITFQDNNFKQSLISLGVDTGNDGEISMIEASNVTGEINLQQKNISNLSGIEFFTNLTSLKCGYNNITALDLSQNTKLKKLSCIANQIKLLNVNQNKSLTFLSCGDNQLKDLNVSNNTQLAELHCSNNQLSNINISNNTHLTIFTCVKNKITSLILPVIPTLQQIFCSENSMDTLNINNVPDLKRLDCEQNNLRQIDLSKQLQLIEINCEQNKLNQLNLKNNTQLTYLKCYDNLLTTLDVSNNLLLEYLRCYDNPFLDFICVSDLKVTEKIDVAGGIQFTKDDNAEWRDCNNFNNIIFQDSTMKQTLISLGVDTGGDGEISFIEAEVIDSLIFNEIATYSTVKDLHHFKNLKTLIFNNDVTVDYSYNTIFSDNFIEFDSFPNIKYIDISNVTLPISMGSLSLNNSSTLTVFKGSHKNKFDAAYTFSNCPNLKIIDFQSNNNIPLITNCPALQELYIPNNVGLLQKITLDFSDFLELKRLDCSGNFVSSLNVSKNTKLEYLKCDNNNIDPEDRLEYVCLPNFTLAQNNPNFIKDVVTEWRDCNIITNLKLQETLISIYPNPTNDLIHIDGNHFSNVQLISINGSVLVESNENTISLAEFPQGVYIVKVVLENTTITKRIIKN